MKRYPVFHSTACYIRKCLKVAFRNIKGHLTEVIKIFRLPSWKKTFETDSNNVLEFLSLSFRLSRNPLLEAFVLQSFAKQYLYLHIFGKVLVKTYYFSLKRFT